MIYVFCTGYWIVSAVVFCFSFLICSYSIPILLSPPFLFVYYGFTIWYVQPPPPLLTTSPHVDALAFRPSVGGVGGVFCVGGSISCQSKTTWHLTLHLSYPPSSVYFFFFPEAFTVQSDQTKISPHLGTSREGKGGDCIVRRCFLLNGAGMDLVL